MNKFDWFLTGVLTGAATLYVYRELRFLKQNKISDDRIATIEKIEATLEALEEDPDMDPEELARRWRQESAFIDIITNTDII